MAYLIGALIFLTGCRAPSHSSHDCLNVAFIKDPSTFDPRKAHDLASTTICFMLYEGLFRSGPEGELENAVCESYSLSSDKKTYIFKLKKTHWSDGSVVTAYDFERTWLESLHPEFISPYAYLFNSVKNAKAYKQNLCSKEDVGIKALDSMTLKIELNHPKQDLIHLLSFTPFHPFKSSNLGNLSNGPFILDKVKHHHQILLKSNHHYHDKSKCDLNKICIKILDSEATALSLFKDKQLDLIGGPLSGIPCEDLRLTSPSHVQEMAGSTLCVFNNESKIFKNKAMRQAFAYAIDYDAITKLSPFQIKRVHSFLPGRFSNDIDSLSTCRQSEAQQFLKQGLQELGLTKEDLSKLCYYYGSKPEHNKIAQVLHASWKTHLGLEINLSRLEAKSLQAKITSKEFDLAQLFWLAPYDSPASLVERFSSKQLPKNFSSFESDKLSQVMASFEYNISKQDDAIKVIEEVFSDEIPFIPLNNWAYPYYVSSKIARLSFTSLGTINFTFIKTNKDT